MPMGWLPYVSDYYVGDKTGTILILHQVYICGKTLFNNFNKLCREQERGSECDEFKDM